jgi:hypothetical protein
MKVVRVLDKGYVTDKEYKKLLKAYSKTQLLQQKTRMIFINSELMRKIIVLLVLVLFSHVSKAQELLWLQIHKRSCRICQHTLRTVVIQRKI